MRAKKINFNGNAEVLVNFLTQQFPKSYLAAFKVLLDLKYPIPDHQVFENLLEKVKEEEFVKEFLLNSFTPGDFGLESAVNALDKFQLNIRRNNIPQAPFGAYEYPSEFNNRRMPTPRYHMSNPYMAYGVNPAFQGRTFPMEQYTPWNMQQEFTPSYMGRDWEFGKDLFGDVAASLFGDLISKGMNEEFAYNLAREKELVCRNFLPTFEMEFNPRAQFIFANNFILLGKDVKQSYWAAQFFMSKLHTGKMKTVPMTRTFEKVTPTMKKEFFEPVM